MKQTLTTRLKMTTETRLEKASLKKTIEKMVAEKDLRISMYKLTRKESKESIYRYLNVHNLKVENLYKKYDSMR